MPLTIRRRLIDQVRQWRKIAYAVCLGLVVLAGAIVFLSVSSPGSSVEVVSDTTFFNSDRALRLANAMDQLYSDRVLGSEDAAGVIDWFEEKLPALSMAEMDSFDVRIGDQSMTLRNVSVVLTGTNEEVILVVAPRDTPTVIEMEPLAYASATAMLLELIQVFNARPHQKTLVFLSTEDESTGAVSIERFLQTSPLSDNVTTILSFHELGRERTKALRAGVTAPQNTTPGWYVQLVGQVLARAGLQLDVPGLLSQAADHALSLSRGDQVAGLSRGIASIRLYDDGPGKPSVPGLEKHGVAIERLILSLDTGTEAPPNPGTALLLRSGRYLTNQAITFLGVLMLLPTLAALFIWLVSSRISRQTAVRHLRNLLSFAIPVVCFFIVAYILARGGLIPLYQFQVPTGQGAGIEPRLAPTLILILILGAAFVLSRRFLGYFRPRESRAVTEMARLCAGFFSLLLGFIFLLSRSPFLFLTCLTAAWMWPLATCFAEPVYTGAFWRHRLTSNAPVLLLGLVAPVALYIYVAAAHEVGMLNVWWFLIVQTVSGVYGLLGPLAAVFILAGLAVLMGAKRLRVVPIETLEVTDELTLLEPPAPRSRRKPRDTSRPPLSPWG